MPTYHILSEGSSNAKLAKGDGKGYYTMALFLAPSTLNRYGVDLCPYSTKQCREGCLNSAGRGVFSNVQNARVRKANLYVEQPEEFERVLREDLSKAQAYADANGFILVVRLNGTSDLLWLHIVRDYPRATFYDYTKNVNLFDTYLHNWQYENYHLTFSLSEDNLPTALNALAHEGTVAVVFDVARGEALPATWHGYPVIDGDENDLRFLDSKKVVVGLRAKGKAKTVETGGFIQIGKAS